MARTSQIRKFGSGSNLVFPEIPTPGGGPVAAGSKLAFIGDSFFQRESFITSSLITRKVLGDMNWAQAISPRFRQDIYYDAAATQANLVPTWYYAMAGDKLAFGANFGGSGDSTLGMLKRFQRVINSTPNVVVLHGGTNFGSPPETAPSTAANNLKSMTLAFYAAGIVPVVSLIHPRKTVAAGTQVSPEIGDDRMAVLMQINDLIRAGCVTITQWLAGQRGTWNAIWADTWTPWFDTGAAIPGNPIAGMTEDGVHATGKGAYYSSTAYTPIFNALFLPGEFYNTDPRVGNLMTNGNLTGSITGVGTGTTGVIPTGFSVRAGVNVTCVFSLENNPVTGGQSLKGVVTSDGAGGTTAQTVEIFGPAVTTGVISTDWVESIWRVRKPAGTLCCNVESFWGINTGAFSDTAAACGMGVGNVADFAGEPSMPPVALDLHIPTQSTLWGGNTTMRTKLIIHAMPNIAGSFTFYVDYVKVMKAPNPITLFPWTATIPSPPSAGLNDLLTVSGQSLSTVSGDLLQVL